MVGAIAAIVSLTLMIAGSAIKQPLMLLASSLSWIIFAFLMFGYSFDNTALNTALLMFGGIMSILSAVMFLMAVIPKSKEQLSPEADYEDYKQKVMDATRRR